MEHLTLFPTYKRFRWFLNFFLNVRPVSTPNHWGPDDQRFLTVLRLAFYRVLAVLLGLRLLSRKWMRFGSYSLSQARKTLQIFKIRARQTSSDILSSTFQNFHFFRVKLQTSLYHPIPLDSKPYKQTNRLENLLLFLI